MELDQKIRYAMIALAAASLFLAGLGIHASAHVRTLDLGGGAD